ncbi:hypothetical protein ACFJIV_12295 [Mucilaginibacter sp. UC70_90]
MKNEATIDSEGNAAEISGKGRHDPWCGSARRTDCGSHGSTCIS